MSLPLHMHEAFGRSETTAHVRPTATYIHVTASQKQVQSSSKSLTASLVSVQATTAHMWRVTEAVSVYGHGHHGSKGEGASWYVVQYLRKSRPTLYLAVSRLVRSGRQGLERHDDFDEIADYYHVDPTEYVHSSPVNLLLCS